MRINVAIHEDETGGYWAVVPAFPGCVTEGDTLEELLANVRDAAEGWLEVASERKTEEPPSQVLEIEL